MDDTRCSRTENTLQKQNLRKGDLKDDEAHPRCFEAKSSALGNCPWRSALGTSQSVSRFPCSQSGVPRWLGLVSRLMKAWCWAANGTSFSRVRFIDSQSTLRGWLGPVSYCPW